MEHVDTSPWNLSLTWVLTSTIACGPVVGVVDDESSGTDPTAPVDPSDPSDPTIPNPTGAPGECSYARPCGYGLTCVDGRCEPSPYCLDGGCCYGEEYGYGCGQCYVLVDCGPAQHCYGNQCETPTLVPYCGVVPELVVHTIPIEGGGISGLAFVDREPPLGDELIVGGGSGVSLLRAESGAAASIGPGDLGYVSAIAAGDIDGDGDDDVVADGILRFAVLTALRNDGDGQFERVTEEQTVARELHIADIDGDGFTDRVGVFPLGGPFDQLAVARGNGAFGYEGAVLYATPSAPRAVAVGVLEGPGAAIVAFDGDNLQIWNGGAIVDGPAYWFSGVGGVDRAALAIGDFDGDARPDIVRAVPWSGWTILDVLHATDGGFESSYSSMIPGEFLHVAAVEIDGDGIDDLALVDGGVTLAVLRGGLWSFAQPFACVSRHASGIVGAVDLGIGDYDGDGRDDVAVADTANVAVHSVADPE